jgi:hypothetical protein
MAQSAADNARAHGLKYGPAIWNLKSEMSQTQV